MPSGEGGNHPIRVEDRVRSSGARGGLFLARCGTAAATGFFDLAKTVERHLAQARLLPGKTLETFDFAAVPMVSKAHVNAITAGDSWISKGDNILLFGPPGVGKSHLSSAIGLALVENGYRVLFTRTTDLVQKLQQARRDLALESAIAKLDKFHLLILDDIAHVTKDQAETSVLFELISARYERRSMLITANQALHASHADGRREHEEAIARLQAEHARLGERISAMYVDKLDGKISGAFFEEMSGQWREEQRRLQRDIERHEEAEQSYMEEGLRILELARNARGLFERQPAREKRRLPNFVLSNCSWEDGEVVATFRQPFDLLAETTDVAASAATEDLAKSAKNEIWLGW